MIEQLRGYDKAYYEHGKSFVTDEYYDSMKEIARSKFPNDPYFNEVGSPVISRDKVKLPYVLGSLNKVKVDTVEKWIDEHPGKYVISQKLDGVSILVTYKDGKVYSAYTRGDGEYGRDITDKARIFCSRIENDSVMIVRGEALLLDDTHKELGFSTKRNGVAGILNRDDNTNCEKVVPYFYELIQFGNLETITEYERFVLIESLGLNVPKWRLLKEFDIDEVMSLLVKDSYDVDGVVIALDESKRENTKYPENKVAFKVQGESVETTVLDVEWNVTRTGKLAPVVVVEPIEIGGVVINRATGFNAENISLGMITKGSIVSITRANDVIPYISGVVSCPEYAEYMLPKRCPSCNNELVSRGVDIICTNVFCSSRQVKSTEYFLRTLGAENITYKTLEKLNINSIYDAYEIDDFTISNIESFGVRSGEIIVREIQNTLRTTQEKLLQAFGIPGVGQEISKSLLRCFGNIETILDMDEKDLQQCEGVGPKIAENIKKCCANCQEMYKYLMSIGMEFVGSERKEDNMIGGKIFTLTGKGTMGRKELTELIEGYGGIVKGISKDTTYLVTSDMDSTSGKTQKAKQYGTQIISYEQLMEMLGL